MIDILTLVEELYSSNHKKYIYNPSNINQGRFTSSLSRYSDTYIKSDRCEPYVPSIAFINKLIKHIQFINITDSQYELNDNLCTNEQYLDEIVIHNNSKYESVIIEPVSIKNLLYNFTEVTPLGLLAIRMQKFYGDLTFKKWVEDNYLLKYFFCIGDGVYIDREKPQLRGFFADEYLKILGETLPITGDIFKWR